MQVAIDSRIYQQAQAHAEEQGLNLSEIIEKFLMYFVGRSNTPSEQPVPDVVLSLLGTGEPIADDDLNGREAYYQYIEEKYK